MGEQDWCLEGLNYSIWGKTFKSSGSSREGNMMSVGVEAPGSREAPSSRAGCSSMGGSLCCSWGQSPAPIWPAQLHPSLLHAAPTQPFRGTGRLRNASCLNAKGSKGAAGCWCRVKGNMARTAGIKEQLWFIFHPVCLQRASSRHLTVSSPFSVLHPVVEYQACLYPGAVIGA